VSIEESAFQGDQNWKMRISLPSRPKEILPASRNDLRSRGGCFLPGVTGNQKAGCFTRILIGSRMDRRSRSISLAGMILVGVTIGFVTAAFAANSVSIQLAHHTPREMQTAQALKQLLATNDLHKYMFTRDIVIEERAMNHAFPVLTLNVRFADSPDELLSSFVHEQLHWHLRIHDGEQKAAIFELRQMYPTAPVGLPEGADSAYSTYGHLVDCYLEIQADRELIGPTRTEEVIKNKPWYTWIYKTVLRDEPRIRAVVQEHFLEVK
jgi:hypothetical protein